MGATDLYLFTAHQACAMQVDYFESELLPLLKGLLPRCPDSVEFPLFQALEEARAPFTTFLDLAP